MTYVGVPGDLPLLETSWRIGFWTQFCKEQSRGKQKSKKGALEGFQLELGSDSSNKVAGLLVLHGSKSVVTRGVFGDVRTRS